MRMSEAIRQADNLRDNLLDETQKAAWVHNLDCELAEIMGVDAPTNRWPEEDRVLLMPSPHDDVYPKYLIAQIDYYNQETALYANDMALYNAAMSAARGWWRRHHRPTGGQYWRVM